MAENTKIEWAHHTFNAWIGCTKVGPGCDNCYAADLATARLGVAWGPGQPRRRTAASTWRQPRRWNKRAAKEGVRYRVFCSSLADVFDNEVDPAWRADLFQLIRETPHLDWLLVTKRVGNVRTMAEAAGCLPDNVWLGITVVNQAEADRDIPKLLEIKAAVRFLSMEPLLGPVDLTSIKAPRYPDEPEDSLGIDWRFDALTTGDYYWFDCGDGYSDCGDGPYREHRIDWVVLGGESGPGARPMHPGWARAIRDQCARAILQGDDAPVPFFFKQWGEWREWDDGNGDPEPEEVENDSDVADWIYSSAIRPAFIAADGRVYDRKSLPEEVPCRLVERVGKKAAGRLLDGVEHNAMPTGNDAAEGRVQALNEISGAQP